MTQPLSRRLADQMQALTAMANQVARDGHEALGTQIAIHAAQLACHETTARRLEQELLATEAAFQGSRAARRQAEATVRHLTAELLEAQDLQRASAEPAPNPAHQATIDAMKADLSRLKMVRLLRYATPIQAAIDMQRLAYPTASALLTLWEHLRSVISQPEASSDHLLLCADALRTQAHAAHEIAPSYAEQLGVWANTLTDLAPSRANPLEDA